MRSQRCWASVGHRSIASSRRANSSASRSVRARSYAIERALAHQDSNAVRAVYNRSAYWSERVEMMQWWSDELDAIKNEAG
jgi:integrase